MPQLGPQLPPVFGELKRRKVFRVAAVYGVIGWIVIQVAATTFPYLDLPRWMVTAVIVLVLLGFPVALVLAWSFQVTASPGEGSPEREPVGRPGTGPEAEPGAIASGSRREGPDLPGASGRRLPAILGGVGLLLAAAVGLLVLDLPAEFGPRDAGGADDASAEPGGVVHLEQLTFSAAAEEYPAFAPDGTRLALSREVAGFRHVFVRDLASEEETQLTRGAADHIQPAWSPDGSVLAYVRATGDAGRLEPFDVFGPYQGGDVWRHEIATGQSRRILEDAYNPAFSPDGFRIAFDASWVRGRRIWVADELGRNPEQLSTDVSESVAHVAPTWSPDGELIAYQRIEKSKMDILTLHLASGRQRWVTDDPFRDVDPYWSPAGGEIFFTSYRGGGLNLWRARVTGEGAPAGTPRQVTTGAGQDVHVTVDTAGRRVAFATRSLNADLWRLPVDPETGEARGEPEPVVATTREDSRGAWSPDGRRIAFNSDRTGDMNLWTHSLETGTTRRVTEGPGGDFQPRWSPDGQRIVFFSSRVGNADVWTVDVATGVLQQLTTDSAQDVNPFYSSDGRWIAFQSDRGGRKEVWIMAADGSGQRQLSTTGASDHFMLWTGGDRSILHTTSTREGDRQYELAVESGESRPVRRVRDGFHMSFSPDSSLVMDVVGHRELWVTPLGGGEPRAVFESPDPEVRIDYPVWSPDGRWALFDRSRPTGADVWLLELARE